MIFKKGDPNNGMWMMSHTLYVWLQNSEKDVIEEMSNAAKSIGRGMTMKRDEL